MKMRGINKGDRSRGSIGRACMCLRSRGRKPCNSCNSCDKLNQVQSCAPQTPTNLIEFVA